MSDTRDPEPSDSHPITEVNVTELSVETTGVLRERSSGTGKPRWSQTSLWMGIVSVLLAPVFGLGILPAILSIVVGHMAKAREPQGFVQWTIGLGLSYLAIIVGTAVVILVALPLTLAFLISTGYILGE